MANKSFVRTLNHGHFFWTGFLMAINWLSFPHLFCAKKIMLRNFITGFLKTSDWESSFWTPTKRAQCCRRPRRKTKLGRLTARQPGRPPRRRPRWLRRRPARWPPSTGATGLGRVSAWCRDTARHRLGLETARTGPVTGSSLVSSAGRCPFRPSGTSSSGWSAPHLPTRPSSGESAAVVVVVAAVAVAAAAAAAVAVAAVAAAVVVDAAVADAVALVALVGLAGLVDVAAVVAVEFLESLRLRCGWWSHWDPTPATVSSSDVPESVRPVKVSGGSSVKIRNDNNLDQVHRIQ